MIPAAEVLTKSGKVWLWRHAVTLYGWPGYDSEVGLEVALEVAEGVGKIGVGELAGLEVILALAWSIFDAQPGFSTSRVTAHRRTGRRPGP